MNQGAREVAVRFLLAVDRGKHCDALPVDPGFLQLDPRDRRLTTDLVLGTLRNRARLDFYARSFSKRPLTRLDLEVLWILRLGFYQLEFLRVPARATVHETVGLTRKLGKSSASGFVNGILRSFSRDRPELPGGDSVRDLAIVFSHPNWLVDSYIRRWGVEAAKAFMEQNNRQPVSTLRVNPFKTDLSEFCRVLELENIGFARYPELPNCLIVAPDFVRHPLYEKGLCSFMDASSQRVAHEVSVEGAQVVGDFCAAPGGKSFILADRLPSGAHLYSSDISRKRLSNMKKRLTTGRISNLSLFQADWATSIPVRSCFDSVLLDVPCSGLGTIRSNPDIRWRFRMPGLRQFQQRQLELLRRAYSSLRPQGKLLYSTCSTEPEENEEVVKEFLEEESGATFEGFGRTFPGPCPGDAFFWARIRHS